MPDRDDLPTGPRPLRPAAGEGDGPWARASAPDGSRSGPPRGMAGRWADLAPSDHLPTLTDPFSLVTEKFRLLRVKLDSSEGPDGESPRVIAFTSAVPGEGKTCTALNTAVAAGQEVERQVVLVECDMRRRRIGNLLDNPTEIGLAQLLQGRAELQDVLYKMDRPAGLSIIASGRPPTNPVELLGSESMKRLLQQLRSMFDLVLLDTPPGLNFADAARLGPMVDGYVLVVRSGVAPRDGVAKLHHALSPFGIIGVVLNDADPGSASDYGYYYRNYGGAEESGSGGDGS